MEFDRLDFETEDVIALAWHQGLLKGDLNVFQRFAAQYQVRQMRLREVSDIEDTLQKQLYYLNPNRYQDVFPPEKPWVPDPLDLHANAPEEIVDDLDEVDRYFRDLEERREVTGGEVFSMGTGEWQ